jgi:hypothetical protein
MAEPELFNETNFRVQALPFISVDGADCRLVVVKASYGIQRDSRVLKLRNQRDIRLADEMWGPPEIPDVKFPGDLCEYRPGTDVIVVGHARTPGETQVRTQEVSVEVANRELRLRVSGPRVFRRTLFGAKPSRPMPFQAVPLAWSHSWGGADFSRKKPLEDARNPVGRGMAHRRRQLAGTPAPQVEHADRRQRRRRQPAGCAPLSAAFEPRRTLAGTYDASWLANRHPARPSDYDPRAENRAAPELVFERPLRGGERVRIAGMRHDGVLEFVIPRVYLVIQATIDGAAKSERPHLDSVLVDVDARVLELTWRASFPCPPQMRGHFQEILVQEREVQ